MNSVSEGRSRLATRWTRDLGAVCVGVLVVIACGEGVGRALFGVYLSGIPTATGALLSAYAFVLLAAALEGSALAGSGRIGAWLAARSPFAAAVRRVFVDILAAGVVGLVAFASALGAYRFLSRAAEPDNRMDPDPVVALTQAVVAAGAAMAAVTLLFGLQRSVRGAIAVWKRRPRGRDGALAIVIAACFGLAIWGAQGLLGDHDSWTIGGLVLLGASMAALLAGGLHPALLMVVFFPAVVGFEPGPNISRVFLLGSEAMIVPVLALLAVTYRAAGMVDDLEIAGRWMFGGARTGTGLAFFFRTALAGAVTALGQNQARSGAEEDVPRLVRAGFWPRTAVGSFAAASAFGAVLPPSLVLSLYAMESHAGAFAFAGLAASLVVLASMCLISLPGSLREDAASPSGPAPSAAPRAASALSALVRASAPPAIVLLAVLLQRFTLAEAGAIATVAVVAIGVASRRLRWSGLWPLLHSTTRHAVPLLFILVAGGVYAWLMTAAGIPQFLTLRLDGSASLAVGFAALIGAVALLRWLEVDPVSALMVLFPIWLPLMKVLSGSLAPDRFGVLLLLAVQTVALLVPRDSDIASVRRAVGDATLPPRRIVGAAFPFAAVALALTILLAVGSHAG